MDITHTWPWYVSGPLIATTMFLLLWLGKRFGVSTNLETTCTIAGAGKKIPYFNKDWKNEKWNLIFAAGSVIGGFIASTFLMSSDTIQISEQTRIALSELGLSDFTGFAPSELFHLSNFSPISALFIILGGFLIGFGTRYAGGCTSGHSISGLSNLQLSSLIATVAFFAGGLLATHILLPLILK